MLFFSFRSRICRGEIINATVYAWNCKNLTKSCLTSRLWFLLWEIPLFHGAFNEVSGTWDYIPQRNAPSIFFFIDTYNFGKDFLNTSPNRGRKNETIISNIRASNVRELANLNHFIWFHLKKKKDGLKTNENEIHRKFSRHYNWNMNFTKMKKKNFFDKHSSWRLSDGDGDRVQIVVRYEKKKNMWSMNFTARLHQFTDREYQSTPTIWRMVQWFSYWWLPCRYIYIYVLCWIIFRLHNQTKRRGITTSAADHKAIKEVHTSMNIFFFGADSARRKIKWTRSGFIECICWKRR